MSEPEDMISEPEDCSSLLILVSAPVQILFGDLGTWLGLGGLGTGVLGLRLDNKYKHNT